MVESKSTKHVPIRVCLLENNPLAARELARKLHLIRDIRIIRFKSGCLSSVTLGGLTILVVDRGTLSENCSRCTLRLRSLAPLSRILVLDRIFSKEEMVELLATGADGFLSYEDVDIKLGPAVRALAKGRMWTPIGTLEDCVRQLNRTPKASKKQVPRLTAREMQVLDLVGKRLPNKQIGFALGISEGTVKFHLANIFTKLGVRERLSAVEAGLSSLDDVNSLLVHRMQM